MKASGDINAFNMDDVKVEKVEKQPDPATKAGDNALKDIENKLMSIVSSLDAKKEEDENIKELLHDLKEQHGLKPKNARLIAKWLQDPSKFTESEQAYLDAEELFKKLSK